MGRTRFNSQIVPKDVEQALAKVWIPGADLGPFAVSDGGDEIGAWGGVNAADSEVLTYIFPIPHDMDVSQPIILTDILVFDEVSDADEFEIDHLYTLVALDATTDPVHVAPATAFDDEDGALTIVEATHESRLYVAGPAQIDGATITEAQQDARGFIVLGWEINLTTMTEDQFILVGTELQYTRRFV
jgi:hypothetical protein